MYRSRSFQVFVGCFGLGLFLGAVAFFFVNIDSIYGQTVDEEEIFDRVHIDELKQEKISLIQRLNQLPLLIETTETTQGLKSDLRTQLQIDLQELELNKDDSEKSRTNILEKEKEIEELKGEIEDLRQQRIGYLTEISNVKEKINELDTILNRGIVKPSNVLAVGIVLSNSCLVEIENPVKNPNVSICPTYKDLTPLDSSNHDVTGSFSDGVLGERLNDSNYVNSWRWYDLDGYNIFVDPPAEYVGSLKMIYIEQTLKDYTNPNQTDKTQNIREFSNDRFVDRNCKDATIKSEDWLKILPDTINYIRNNCADNQTTLDTIRVVEDEITEQDITTSQKWITENYYASVLDECLLSFGACTDMKSPWSNPEW